MLGKFSEKIFTRLAYSSPRFEIPFIDRDGKKLGERGNFDQKHIHPMKRSWRKEPAGRFENKESHYVERWLVWEQRIILDSVESNPVSISGQLDLERWTRTHTLQWSKSQIGISTEIPKIVSDLKIVQYMPIAIMLMHTSWVAFASILATVLDKIEMRTATDKISMQERGVVRVKTTQWNKFKEST